MTQRPCRFELRLTPEEFRALGELAGRAHLSISAFVRVRLFGLGGEHLARPQQQPRRRAPRPAAKLPSSEYCPATEDHAHRFRPVSQLMMGGGELRTCNWCEWKEVLR